MQKTQTSLLINYAKKKTKKRNKSKANTLTAKIYDDSAEDVVVVVGVAKCTRLGSGGII